MTLNFLDNVDHLVQSVIELAFTQYGITFALKVWLLKNTH